LKSPTPLSILPGLALVVAVALAARTVHHKVPPQTGKLVGEVIFAVLIGLVVGNVFRIPKLAQPGIRFAFQTLLRAAIVLVYTDRIRHPLPLLGLVNPPRRLPGGAVVSTFDLLTVGAAAALFLALFAFLRLSPLGIQMRAAGEKALLAAQRGINFQLLFALSWALAGFAGALAGILYANNVRLDPSLGVLGLKAFAVALVGGLDSLAGVIPGALIVAAVEVLSVRYGDPLLADVSPFLCLLAMLLVRPWGLFGTKEELERV